MVVDVVLIEKVLTSLNVVKLVKGHGGLSPGFTLDRFQKLLENQNIHHFEISRIHRDDAFAGKLTLTKQSKSRQFQRKAVDQREEPAKSSCEVHLSEALHQYHDDPNQKNPDQGIQKRLTRKLNITKRSQPKGISITEEAVTTHSTSK